MAEVTGLTAEAMADIANSSITSARIANENLILTTRDGRDINLGKVLFSDQDVATMISTPGSPTGGAIITLTISTANDAAETKAVEVLAGQPGLVAAAQEALETEAGNLQLVLKTDPGIPQEIATITDRVLLEVDESDKISRFIDSMGRTWISLHPTVILPGGQIATGSITRAAFNSDLMAATPELDTNPESPYAWIVVDESQNIGLGIREDGVTVGAFEGTFLGTVTIAPGTLSEEALSASAVSFIETANEHLVADIPEITGVTPDRKLWVNTREGSRVLISEDNDPNTPLILKDRAVLFKTDIGDRWANLDTSELGPVLPRRTAIATHGDSLTDADIYPNRIGANFGISVENYGQSGWCSADIATKQGGLRPLLTLSGDLVPSSGAVGVVARNPATGWRLNSTASSASWTGYLDLGDDGTVAGTLTHIFSSDTWTFTRTGAGSEITCPPETPFVCTQADVSRDAVSIFFSGRNNLNPVTYLTAVADVIRDETLMYNHLSPYVKQALFIPVLNGTGETVGTTGYNRVMAINDAKAVAFGPLFYDLRRDFIDQGLARAGITPTSTDLATIAGDAPPPSLMTDFIHPNAAGYTVMGDLISEFIEQKGWFAQ